MVYGVTTENGQYVYIDVVNYSLYIYLPLITVSYLYPIILIYY